MNGFIDTHRERFGVEPVCRVLQVAPSAYRRSVARRRDPALRCARARRDEVLAGHIERVWQANLQVYGVRKIWRQLRREGIKVARCTVERLMHAQGLRGAGQGFVYVAFVIDVFARYIVGWRVSRSMHTEFVLDALEQELWARQPERNALIHHSDRGSQYVSIRYSERLSEAGIEPSVGSRGDSYDNALAETINGLYKAEVIHRRGPWKSVEAVELATLEWVSWFNHHRLLGPIGYIPPAEAEANYYRNLNEQAIAA